MEFLVAFTDSTEKAVDPEQSLKACTARLQVETIRELQGTGILARKTCNSLQGDYKDVAIDGKLDRN